MTVLLKFIKMLPRRYLFLICFHPSHLQRSNLPLTCFLHCHLSKPILLSRVLLLQPSHHLRPEVRGHRRVQVPCFALLPCLPPLMPDPPRCQPSSSRQSKVSNFYYHLSFFAQLLLLHAHLHFMFHVVFFMSLKLTFFSITEKKRKAASEALKQEVSGLHGIYFRRSFNQCLPCFGLVYWVRVPLKVERVMNNSN